MPIISDQSQARSSLERLDRLAKLAIQITGQPLAENEVSEIERLLESRKAAWNFVEGFLTVRADRLRRFRSMTREQATEIPLIEWASEACDAWDAMGGMEVWTRYGGGE
jgi:hypothetical protein